MSLDGSHSVLTIGNFDGVHLGHREILHQVLQAAKKRQALACVYTFRPHPQEVLRPGTQVKLLTTYDEKLEVLESLGLDVAVEEPFSQEFFTLSARDFFNKVVLEGFRAKALFVGHDFAFGKNREGNLALLRTLCEENGIELTVISQQSAAGSIVSSTVIRNYLLQGEVAKAATLLGQPFFYRGTVVKGDQRGRLLGFPTANLKIENKLTLPSGVYATWAWVERGGQRERFPSVTNIGVRPTFYSGENDLPVVVETHLILPTSLSTIDLYGERLEVQFVERLREERRFPSREDLVAQIKLDRIQAEEVLKRMAVNDSKM